MPTNTATEVQLAIQESIQQDSIVHIEGNAEIIETLLAECDDHTENGSVHEFWGTDEDGDSWRIHVQGVAQ